MLGTSGVLQKFCSVVGALLLFAGALSCASGNAGGDLDASATDAASVIADATIDAPTPDSGTTVGTCEECQGNQDCDDTHQCVATGGGKVCLQRCTPEDPECPDGFMCGGVETTFCAPIDGLCCVDGDDDTYGQGIACVGPDCNDSDATINPGMDDVCNGVDDDCAPATPDGTDDPALGDDCDGLDTDLCKEGVKICTLGSLVCDDATDDEIDVCDGVDNDCNPGTLDGSGEAEVGTACDSTADLDLCLDDKKICDSAAMMIICVDLPLGSLDLCDGVDNDCDPTTPDGSGDPGVGIGCDGGDTDLCLEGTTFCSGGVILCNDATGDAVDLCDGTDNDCDPSTLDGSGDPSIGGPCDGPDTDLCEEGLLLCSVGVLVCTDTSGNNLDVCNALDDDCNPATPDGAHDTGVGLACDGADTDLCQEGATFCSAAGTIACDDLTPGNPELCDGADNDCNPTTADGSGDALVGVSCDGGDTDLCNEGATFCGAGGVVTCGDTTGNTLELCDGADNDCNPATDDGADEVWLGAVCDGPDTDLCTEGIYECSGGAQSCTDGTGDNIDVCDAVDNDCNPATADGSGDSGVGVLCDGTDVDLCEEANTFCGAGGIIQCSDTTGDSFDVCDGVDNDCNPLTADGSGDSSVGVSCDGGDSDLCLEGTTFCSGGSVLCDDPLSDDVDLCNGVDDDCNPATLDGAAESWLGNACDGTDSDLCNEGVYVCTGATQVCTDSTGNNLEVCDGADNDCNGATADGADEAWLGNACDGADSDLCQEGVYVCTGSQTCTDTTGGNVELCDGVDNDCNPGTIDGSGDALVGVSCDGADTDLCAEGTTFCAGSIQCSDTSGNNAELCNGVDDDCNAGTLDGSGDPGVGVLCDGPDGDLCLEGSTFCSGGTTQCSDTTGTLTDVCDGVDNDCNAATADGSQDPLLGALCDGADGDACLEGTYSCPAGALSCSDTTGTIVDICDGVDNDCDVSVDELGGSTCPTQHTGAIHVSSWSCSGACVIAGCDSTYVDIDTLVGTGCECGPVDSWGGSCGAASVVSSSKGSTVNRTGYVSVAGQSDYFRINFSGSPTPPALWNPQIVLSDAFDGYRMDIKTTSCSDVACETGIPTGRTSWSMIYNEYLSTPIDIPAKPTAIIVRVYRPDGQASCVPYQLQVLNP